MIRYMLPLFALVAWCAPAYADRLVLHDGRELVGEVVSESAENLRFDMRLGEARAVITVGKDEIAEHVREPLPAGYFEPAPADARDAESGEADYIVVPIKGAFGTDVHARALQRVLAYAWRNRVQHVVFEVDSASFDDLDETREVFRQLQNFADRLTYHAVVKRAGGEALAILIASDTIHPLAGATIGGVTLSGGEDADADELAALQHSVAVRAAAVGAQRGRNGAVIAALIDPAMTFAAWRTADGEIATADEPPADLPAEQVIARCGADEVLTLTSAQLAQLGLPTYEGNAAGLGKALGLDTWRAEGGYGVRTMARVAEEESARTATKSASFERAAAKALAARDSLVEALEHDLSMAAQWDPTAAENNDYSTYKRQTWSWSWSTGNQYGRASGGGEDTNVLTKDSQKRWRGRSDACLRYLNQAIRDVGSLARAERRVEKYGLDRLHSQEELDQLEKDLKDRRTFTAKNRNRKER